MGTALRPVGENLVARQPYGARGLLRDTRL